MPRKRKPAPTYTLKVNAPVNGRIHKAELLAFDGDGKVCYTDRANLTEAAERKKAARRMAQTLKLRNPAKLEADVEAAWADRVDARRVEQEQAAKQPPAATPAQTDPAYPYLIEHGRICRRRYGRDGEEFVEPLCNFSARIVEETTHDDGAEVRHAFTVAGTLDSGKPLPLASVPASEFAGMNWVVQEWGSQAIANAGQGSKDHIRAAIQRFSLAGVRRRVVYAHAGWRQLDGEWAYLHAGGAIGPIGPIPGIETALPDTLTHATLPAPPAGEQLALAVRASLALIDLGPERVTAPAQGATYRAALGDVDFSLYIVGSSGCFKTELATLCQQHYGSGFASRNLPGNWHSTANATEALAFGAKDMLLVVDDFAPGGTQAEVSRMHREADRVFRSVGNRSGRGRLRADGTMRPVRPPRALILSTGEDIPRGHSVRGRMGIVEVSKGDITSERLTRCQADAAAGLYALALSGYLAWLAPRYDAIRAGLREEARALRERYQDEAQHSRTPGIRADLALGWKYFLAFAVDAGAVGEEEARDYRERAGAGLKIMARAQASHQQAAEPVAQFLSLIRSALASGRAHVAAPTGGYPGETPDAWGWRKEDTHEGPTWKPQGRRIGWTEGEDLYLDPGASHAEAQRLAGEQGESLPIGCKTLSKRLEEKGKLKTTDRDRGKLTVRRLLEHRRPDVWHLCALEVLCVEKIGPIGPDEGNPFEDMS